MRRSDPCLACLAFAVTLLVFGAAADACLWDDDTLRAEAEELPGVVAIVTGRFDRPPPLYYEMRLRRAAAAAEADPGRLAEYDNAAVAADRLGDSTGAIAWMARKRAALDPMPADERSTREHRYRYHANLGTFHAHRWLRAGSDRVAVGDLEAAERHIARAIDIHPDAHFGRERYQLLAIRALLAASRRPVSDEPTHESESVVVNGLFHGVPGLSPTLRVGTKQLHRLGYDDAVEGLSGLIALGDAWESVDVFYALGVALDDEGHAAFAYLARLRIEALLAAGRRSLLAGDRFTTENLGRTSTTKSAIEAYYAEARVAADAWQARRRAFALERLRAGRHPDTDPTFREGFPDSDPPSLPWFSFNRATGWILPAALALLLGCAIVVLLRAARAARAGARRLRTGGG